MRKLVYSAALALATLPVAANAAFLVTYPSSKPVPVPPAARNDFATELGLKGIHRFTDAVGSMLSLTTSGLITFEYFGKESLLREVFKAGPLTFSPPGSPVKVNLFAAPQNLGTFAFTPASFKPTFNSVGVPGVFGPGDPTGHFGIGIADGKPASGSYATNVVWLMFDDNAQPDDNHDDLIIRATFAVPEPSTWAMMILGFGVIGLVMRRRTQQRVSFI